MNRFREKFKNVEYWVRKSLMYSFFKKQAWNTEMESNVTDKWTSRLSDGWTELNLQNPSAEPGSNKTLNVTIFKNFSNAVLQNDIVGVLPRQPYSNLDNLHISLRNSPSQCQDYNTEILNRNTSANKIEKENSTRIALNKRICHH